MSYVIKIRYPSIFGAKETIQVHKIDGIEYTTFNRLDAQKEVKRINNNSDYYNHDLPKNCRPRAKVFKKEGSKL